MATRARRFALLFASAGLFFGISTVPATADVVITGAGWGHGVGLSQYGAKVMATDGATYEQIISRYFAGTTIAPYTALNPEEFISTDQTPLWVGLRQQSESLGFVVEQGTAELCFDTTNFCVATARPGEDWRFTRDGSGGCVFFLRTEDSGPIQIAGPSLDCVASVRPGSVESTLGIPFKARSYRHGILRFRTAPSTGLLQSVLEIGVEDYLRGLSEVPESWPTAAIQTQVVVSRSQALWHALDRGPADMFDTEIRDDCYCNLRDGGVDQVFRGYTGEVKHPQWVAAVTSTAMQVINVNGRIGLGLYFSSSGGRTDNFLDVFGTNDHPYLTSVDDYAALTTRAGNPHATWVASYSQATLADVFGFSWVANAEVIERNDSGSARTLRLVGIVAGRPAQIVVTGTEVRRMLSLRSTTFDVSVMSRFKDVPPEYRFSGEILGLHQLGITDGCTATSFCPGRAVTRAEMAAFLVRALDLAPPPGGDPFTDDNGHLFEDEIESLQFHGITDGCTATSFCPGRAVTRAEMAAFLVRALAQMS